jgi:hypothetical protein
MAKRFYLCPLVQNSKGAWVPSIKDAPEFVEQGTPDGQGGFVAPHLQVITSGFTGGNPDVPWCLVVTNVRNHQSIGALAGVELFPDYPLDAKVQAMHGPTRAALREALDSRGVNVTKFDAADGFRDVIHEIARARLDNAGFDADNFDA